MKRILLMPLLFVIVIVTISMTRSNSQDIFSINSKGLISYYEEIIKSEMKNRALPDGYIFRDSVSLNIGNEVYTLKIGNRWPVHNSPGDYDIIQFFKSGKEVLFFDDGEWLLKYQNSQI